MIEQFIETHPAPRTVKAVIELHRAEFRDVWRMITAAPFTTQVGSEHAAIPQQRCRHDGCTSNCGLSHTIVEGDNLVSSRDQPRLDAQKSLAMRMRPTAARASVWRFLAALSLAVLPATLSASADEESPARLFAAHGLALCAAVVAGEEPAAKRAKDCREVWNLREFTLHYSH